MAELDEGAGAEAGRADELLPLLIAVAPSAADRIRLAERLEGIAPLLLVSDLDELRRLIANAPSRPADDAAPDELLIDTARPAVRHGDREVGLTRLELALLACLRTEPVRAWSYRELHRAVWQDEGLERKADVQSLVKRLRRKLSRIGTGVTIDAVRGVGFRLTDHRQPRVSSDVPAA
ncbi:winged helix-turn-helix domain-containing protein [Actinoplanes friuliensis]|uniref:winged helix-turn-helix domain-containing protein n=1 Tax=Actinoplanes friuliensis TaxID=196914 RepID=UPI0005A0E87D|nr:winged helix-turn-helix domain-containing protein [Actinoplanes friuliensis]